MKAKECIAFDLGKFDSHAAYDPTAFVYTFVVDGTYIVTDSTGLSRKVEAKAGDTLLDVKRVVGDNCGLFFTGALKDVKE